MPNRRPPKRRHVGGWSAGSCRRNTAFLRSVVEHDLREIGVTFTLTMRDCPEDARAFHRARRAYLMRLTRGGALRCHWVVEWQRRGVPHLHGIAYFHEQQLRSGVPLSSWLDVANQWRPEAAGQHFRVVTDVVGWLQYLGKHASRGVGHYQRNPKNVPRTWKGRTGRVWGHVGDWPLREPISLEVGKEMHHELRRMVRGWRIADARAAGSPKRIRSARRMLQCRHRQKSELRGISEWLPPAVFDRMIEHLHREGHPIEHYQKPPRLKARAV